MRAPRFLRLLLLGMPFVCPCLSAPTKKNNQELHLSLVLSPAYGGFFFHCGSLSGVSLVF
jgi:hypothetical protein